MSRIVFANEREACFDFIAARRLLLKASFYSRCPRALSAAMFFVTGINNPCDAASLAGTDYGLGIPI